MKKMKKNRQYLAFLLAFTMLAGVMPLQVPHSEAAKKSQVKKITLNVKQYVLKKGEKVRLKAKLSPKKAKTKLVWKSTNKKVAKVNSKGWVTARAKKGKAVITVKAGKKKVSCRIIVGTPVKKIKAKNMSLAAGQTALIRASVVPGKASVKKLVYKSGAPSVVKVNKKGRVTALKPGVAKVKITAADRSKVKKVIRVQVSGAGAANPGAGDAGAANPGTGGVTPGATNQPGSVIPVPETPGAEKPDGTDDPGAKEPQFTMSFDRKEASMKIGDEVVPKILFTPASKVTDQDVTWTSTDDTVAAVVSTDGTIRALTPGTTTITAVSQQDDRVQTSMKVTVSKEGVTNESASSQSELLQKLSSLKDAGDDKNVILTLNTKEEKVVIPEGEYDHVTLVVKAPKATVENSATFKQVIVEEIATDTWCEKRGNHIYIDSAEGHIISRSEQKTNVYLLDESESITVDANKNLQQLLVASAAKVLVKSDSVAERVSCRYMGPAGIGMVETYMPLDIYSTTSFKLLVGPGGEQTAVRVSGENDIPDVSGLGTISVTVDSTGSKKTVIAKYSKELKNLPATTVRGMVKKNDGNGADGATVYLVRYFEDITNDNVSVYLDGSSTKKTETDASGSYSFETVALGNYVIVAEADGYQLLTQNIYIDSLYGPDRTYEVDDIILMDTDGEPGRIEGTLRDASTGKAVSEGLRVILRKGMNNITTNEVDTVESDDKGGFAFEDVPPGQYTIQVRDDSERTPYVSLYENVSVPAGATVTKNMTLTRAIDTEEVRFVLTWGTEKSGASKDLDIYLYGPDPFRNGEYGVSFSGGSSNYGYLMDGSYVTQFATLDVDDKAYDGPETITVKRVTKGQYKVFVQDYSNGGSGNQLRESDAVVKVYKGNTLLDTVKMPEKDGGVWFAGCFDGETCKFTAAGEVYNGKPNTTVRAKIAGQLNKLEQFEVIDAAAFALDQKLIDEVKKNYLKESVSEKKLGEYLESLEKLVEKLKTGLTMKRITAAGGVDQAYGSFCDNHGLATLYGKEEKLKDLNVEFMSEDADFSCRETTKGSSYPYRLTLTNTALGVSTAYYFNYYYTKPDVPTEYWVQSIKDPDNTGWKQQCYVDNAYTGGDNAEIGRNLQISLMDGIRIESMEYAADAKKDSWEYGEYHLVLHLKKEATGDTKDYKIKYKPLGAELVRITDTTNHIVSQYTSSYSYWYEDSVISYRVTGENKEMGDQWQAVVSDGATYKLEDPDPEEDDPGLVAVMTVSKANGAKKVYRIYYEQDTSDAAIVGIYDKDNMYTYYSEGGSTTYRGKKTWSVTLQGMNSELGTGLKIFTKPGATAKVEYATDSVSWDRTSDAKVTVTAKSGQERIYYISYSKSSKQCDIRGISSKSNTLKKVYLSDSYLYITGGEEKLETDDSLKIQTNAGYTASYSAADKKFTVKEEQTGRETTYPVKYTQDTSGFSLKDVQSRKGKIYSVDISTSLYSPDGKEGYYLVNLVGEEKTCPSDLNAAVPDGATAKVTYAGEDWPYSGYAAKIEVTDGTYTQKYLVSYKQDESGAVVKNIRDTKNSYTYTSISNSTTTMYMSVPEDDPDAPASEEVYMIYVVGEKAELGDTYQLSLPEGSQMAETIHKGDAGWRYTSEHTSGNYYSDDIYYYTDRVVVKAKNGAERIYVIAYTQDKSGTVVKDIQDEKNSYVYTKVSSRATTMPLYVSEYHPETSEYENAYIIYVKGEKAELGNTYQLSLPEGSQVAETIHKGDAGWQYKHDSITSSYYDKENEKYIYDTYYYTDRVVVKAKNGAKRIYLIAYAQDDSGTNVSGITDEKNTYLNTTVSTSTTKMSMNVPEDKPDAPVSENVYMIYVKGKNAKLGSTYKLTLTEGGQVAETIHKGDAGWRYSYDSTSYSYRDEDSSSYIRDTYYYTDRIVVKAKNGATRVYVIAYAPDQSGLSVNGISDGKNKYLKTKISTDSSRMYMNESEDDPDAPTSEYVYMIYVKGENAEFGSTYQLDLPEGSKVAETIHKGDADWRYSSDSTTDSYYDEDGNYIRETYNYTDRVVVKAKNGLERVYVIAYAPNLSGLSVNGISDEKNTYVNTKISTDSSRMYMNESEDDPDAPTSEEVYEIYVKGENAELGSTYQLDLPEGSRVSETIHKGEAGWRYSSNSTTDEYYDEENKKYVNDTYYYTDRVVVKAKNGLERVYVIAYAPNLSGLSVNGISDEKNTYVNTKISTDSSRMYMNESEDDPDAPTSEEVYEIYVKGENAELGSTYQLVLPEGSRVSETIHKGDAGWRYSSDSTRFSYYDQDDNYIRDTYNYSDRVVVKAKNGLERVYLIAYAPDQSGLSVNGISDEENPYLSTKISMGSSWMYMNESEDDPDAPTSEQVYLIYVKGENANLGNTYQLTLPEGSRVSEMTHKGDAGWRYSSDSTEDEYYDEENERYVYDTYYYTDRVVVKAKNGLERVYVIAYALDYSGLAVNGISDEENSDLNVEVSGETSQMEMNQSTDDPDAPTSEDVYVIYVKGENMELGSTYQLDLPEGSRVAKTTHKGDAGWRYKSDRTPLKSYYDEENHGYVYDTYYYMDRVVVKAKNGLERVYLIAYMPDDNGAKVRGITDEKNTYANADVQTFTSRMFMKDSDSSEYVYMIYVRGENAELGNTYQLVLPEGCRVIKTTHKGDDDWLPYRLESTVYTYGKYSDKVSASYLYTDRVVVQAKNGVERVYMIAYAQIK